MISPIMPVLILFLLASSYTVTDAISNLKNPKKCKKYMSPSPENLPSIEKTKFISMAVNEAMNQAIDALNHIKLHEPKFQSVLETSALSDCWQFYDSTVRQLNQTLNPRKKSGPSDIQTWLSAALTNLENCKTSMNELNIKNPVLNLLSNNVSELISNGLAINGELIEKNPYQSWLSDGDLRVLRVSKYGSKFVVAKDGSGDFRTIKEALNASFRRKNGERMVIRIKKGTYHEYLEISAEMKNIMLVGDGMGKTIITGNKSFEAGYSTLESSTVKVMGEGFIARGITFRNSAGPTGNQAVALHSSSDMSAFYRCAFEGYQDTLWANTNRQFYKECHIYGTVDFIFGNAAAVFQNCFIYARKPKHSQSIVITAQGRYSPYQTTGISIINCRVMAAPGLKPVIGKYRAYLGRPWNKYSRTVYLKSYLDSLMSPMGWMDWKGEKSRERSVYYGEYRNYGPGSTTSARVKWPGYKVITDVNEAEKFSVGEFIVGQAWLPRTGVPFSGGL